MEKGSMNKILGNKKAYFIFVFPAFVIYFVMAFIPIIISCYYSTLEWNGIGQKVFVGIENFFPICRLPISLIFFALQKLCNFMRSH